MNSRTVFKFIVFLLNWLIISLVSVPFTLALIALATRNHNTFQYGYDFIELNNSSALLISVAIGIVFSVWNAMAFSEATGVELKQFMKAWQKYKLKSDHEINSAEMKNKISRFTQANKNWKLRKVQEDGEWKFEVSNRFAPKDVVTVKRNGNEWLVESRPKLWIYFIDMARNFRNIEFITKQLNDI
ncbi:MAG: hypothetical protein GC181_00640 [Bacteroidetes bacterium]|nr:hypothetical protein [Bacteroidota bacterium]